MRRQPIAASRGRTLLVLVTALTLALPMVAVTPRASADDLSDARAQQRSLQAQIRAQQGAIAQLKAQEGQLQTDIAATNTQLDGINADQATLKTKIQVATAALAAARAQYDALVRQLDQLDWTLGILQGELVDRQASLASRKRLLAARLSEAYQTQQTSLLEQVLSADSLKTVLADVGDYLSVGDQDAQLAQQIQRDQASLISLQRSTDQARFNTDQLASQVAQQSAGLAQQEAQLEAAKQRLDKLEQQTAAILAQQKANYDRIYSTHQAAAAALAKEQAAEHAISQKISDLLAANANSWNIPSQFNGTLIWPMRGIVTQEFGCTGFFAEPPWSGSPYGDCAHFHTGIDIAAAYGTPIRAAAGGTVVYVGDGMDIWGAWIVIIAHGGNLFTLYAHMIAQKPGGIYEGAHVDQGQVIGWEGCTGNCTGPHLHWAVYQGAPFGGLPVNPRLYL